MIGALEAGVVLAAAWAAIDAAVVWIIGRLAGP